MGMASARKCSAIHGQLSASHSHLSSMEMVSRESVDSPRVGSTLRKASSPLAEMAKLMDRRLVMAVSFPLGSTIHSQCPALFDSDCEVSARYRNVELTLPRLPDLDIPSSAMKAKCRQSPDWACTDHQSLPLTLRHHLEALVSTSIRAQQMQLYDDVRLFDITSTK